ncbi:MAG: 50S ribosomal protein L19 [Patescibacteria group bacterium]
MADEIKPADVQAAAEPATEVAPVEAAAPAVVEEIKDVRAIVPGMVVRVHQKIKETTPKGDERERIQIFEGTIIAKKGQDAASATITVRKIASGVGVERIFPLKLPTIAKIEVVKELRVRRAKLYFLRDTKKKLKEKKTRTKA